MSFKEIYYICYFENLYAQTKSILSHYGLYENAVDYSSLTVLAILIFFFFAATVSLIMGLINFIFFFNFNSKDLELKSTYECGFIPFTHRRLNFNINFHLIAILFIIFDLEILFLFPWVVTFASLGLFGFYVMVIFFVILTLGIVVEFKANVLII
jgi:NADH-quinone oxidoreductase subunit A